MLIHFILPESQDAITTQSQVSTDNIYFTLIYFILLLFLLLSTSLIFISNNI